jgi:hypothetical protein
MVDMAVALFIMGTALTTSGPLSRRVIATYQLNGAVQELVADLSQAKIRAIQSNSIATLRRESRRDYRVAGMPRRLPGMVRFEDTSADSVAFNGLGAVTDGAARVFLLTNVYGETRQVRVYAAGGHEVRKS